MRGNNNKEHGHANTITKKIAEQHSTVWRISYLYYSGRNTVFQKQDKKFTIHHWQTVCWKNTWSLEPKSYGIRRHGSKIWPKKSDSNTSSHLLTDLSANSSDGWNSSHNKSRLHAIFLIKGGLANNLVVLVSNEKHALPKILQTKNIWSKEDYICLCHIQITTSLWYFEAFKKKKKNQTPV